MSAADTAARAEGTIFIVDLADIMCAESVDKAKGDDLITLRVLSNSMHSLSQCISKVSLQNGEPPFGDCALTAVLGESLKSTCLA